MNIVIVGPAFPLRGGIAHHVYRLNQLLQHRGHSSHIVSYTRLYPAFLFPGKTMLDSSAEALDGSALTILDAVSPISWIRAAHSIQMMSPDLVVFEWWTAALGPAIGSVARLLGRRGLRCVFECHNIFPHERTVLDLPLVQYGIGAASAFVTFSQINRSYLEELFPDKRTFCTPLPAPFAFPSRGSRAGRTILFFGIVRPYKGLDVLLRALDILVKKVKCKLIIAGEFYEPVERYQSFIRQHKLEAYVELSDRYTPNEEIGTLLSKADVLVLPYRSATQSGVLRMALGSGLPVVASAVGAFTDEIIDGVNGLIVRPGDSEALAGALIRYFNEGLGPRFARNLSSDDSSDDWARLAQLLESLGEQQGGAAVL